MTKKLLFVFLFLFSLSVLNAQETEKIPLSKILAKLAIRYDRIFSYADQLVAHKESEMPPKSFSFQEAMDFLEEQTGISFKNLGMGYIAIYSKTTNPTILPTQNLKPVHISNYMTSGITKKRNGTVEIDYKNFGILPGLIEPDVFLTLQALPGVESVNETVTNINVRGGSNDQNLILWDGIRMYQSGHFFGLISAFNPYQTNTVTLIKNGTSPSYGNSVSSVIAMKTEREINRDFRAAIGVNFINLGAFLDTPLGENTSLQVATRFSLHPFFITPTYEQYYDRAFQETEVISDENEIITTNQEFVFHDFSLRWLYDLSKKDRIRVNFIQISNELVFDENSRIDEELVSKKSELSQNSLGAGLFYLRDWNTNWQTSVQTYFSDYHLQATNVNFGSDNDLFQENNVVETGVKIISNLQWNQNFGWNAGYEFIHTRISNTQDQNTDELVNYSEDILRSHALFSSLNYTSKNNATTFSIGGRLNYFKELHIWRLEPRFSFNHGFLENFNVEVLGELKSQTTTQIIDFQTDFLGIEKRRWRLADTENIPPLRSKQLSLGINFKKNDWLISAETYLKEIKGITSQSQGFQNQYQFARITGSYFVKGFELLLNKKFDHFSSWISYSWTDNTYTFPALSDENFPNSIEIAHSFNLAGSYSIRDFKISAGMKWRSGKPFTPLTASGLQNDELIYEPAFSENLKDYFRVDLSASQQFKLGKNINAYVGISIWNLLGTENNIDSYYQRRDGEVVRITKSALGITPNFTFRVLF